jgi:hypothetical protein
VTSGEFAGMYSKAGFAATLHPETYRVVYAEDGEVLKIFGTDQDDEYEDWLMLGLDYAAVEEEEAFAWPIDLQVEIWDKYKYKGTFVVSQWSKGKRRKLVRLSSATPVGTRAHVHNGFAESEPALRYRRFLDPNWQMALPARVRVWKKEEPPTAEFAEEASGLHHIDGWSISPAFKAEAYNFWRRAAA